MIAQRGHPQPQGGTGSSHPPGPGRLCTRGCSATFKSNGGIADRRCLLVKCLPGVGYPPREPAAGPRLSFGFLFFRLICPDGALRPREEACGAGRWERGRGGSARSALERGGATEHGAASPPRPGSGTRGSPSRLLPTSWAERRRGDKAPPSRR